MQTTWLRNWSELISYCPELGQRIWSEIVDRMLRIDVSIYSASKNHPWIGLSSLARQTPAYHDVISLELIWLSQRSPIYRTTRTRTMMILTMMMML